MSVGGIIAEYNPFHNGHRLQIEHLHEMGYTTVVAIISPWVVQRGEAAILPLRVRVKAALACGVDLALCLPAPYALCSAEGFAAAGVRSLSALGCVDALCFGMEAENTREITDIAKKLLSSELSDALQSELSSGAQYAYALEKAMLRVAPGSTKLLRTANNILAAEYCKALLVQKSPLLPLGIKREGAFHDESLPCGGTLNSFMPFGTQSPHQVAQGAPENTCSSLFGGCSSSDASIGAIASAGALRKTIFQRGVSAIQAYVPQKAFDIYNTAERHGEILSASAFEIAVLSRLRLQGRHALESVRGTNEGLANRLYSAVQSACTLEELYSAMKTKRYPHARMRRLALDAALGYTSALNIPVPYLQVLGATEKGRALLKVAKPTIRLPIGTSLATLAKINPQTEIIANANGVAEALHSLCLVHPCPAGSAYTDEVIML